MAECLLEAAATATSLSSLRGEVKGGEDPGGRVTPGTLAQWTLTGSKGAFKLIATISD